MNSSEIVTITLDGLVVSGIPGMTILELAKESGIKIPTLCTDPHLIPIGACRICIVEDERTSSLLASCVTPIAPGMVINTRSPLVMEHRKNIVKLMLASHPDTCIVCDKGNRCQLRQIAADMGIGLIELYKIPQVVSIEDSNPFIRRDLSKCIMCAKCIRACQEMVTEFAIDYYQRGFITKPATLNDLPLENSNCTFCGTCVPLCPTGALSDKESLYRGTIVNTIDTICPFCACGCSISIESKANKIIRIKPSTSESVNNGKLCILGSYACDFANSNKRLTKPLVKKNGTFEETSWDNALELITTEFKRLMQTSGPESIVIMGSTKCTNEDNYVLQKFGRCVVGTNNIYNGGHFNHTNAWLELVKAIGFQEYLSNISDIEQSDLILLVGTDPSKIAPIVNYALKKAVKYKNAQLLLINPVKTDLASFAKLHISPSPGAEINVINGMIKLIVDNNLVDSDFSLQKIEGFDALLDSLKQYPTDTIGDNGNFSNQKISEFSNSYIKANHPMIIFNPVIYSLQYAANLTKALIILLSLTKNHNGIMVLPQENNARGACDMGLLPDYLPGYRPISNLESVKIFESNWSSKLSSSRGFNIGEMVEKVREKKIKALYIMGENPVVNYRNPSFYAEVIKSVEFIVVQDIFLTETANLANVVLPACSFLEKEGTYTNLEGKVQKLNKILNPFGESLPDWEIVTRLAEKFGYTFNYDSAMTILAEVENCVPHYHSLLEHYKNPPKNISAQETRPIPANNATGKKIKAARIIPALKSINISSEYPFTLIIDSSLKYFGTSTRVKNASRFKNQFNKTQSIEINITDAAKLNIKEGDSAKLTSPTHEITVEIRINTDLPSGLIYFAEIFQPSEVIKLIDNVLNIEEKRLPIFTCPVNIKKENH